MPAQHYSAGKFMLELEGQAAGYIHSVEGGEPFASVVAEAADAKGVVRKSPGPLAYEPIRLSFGSGMGVTVYQWMADMLTGSQTAKNGAIVFLNYNGSEQSRLEFAKGLITEITFPALDAASKDQARFVLTLRPATTNVSKASAGAKGPSASTKKQKNWSGANFRLKLDGLSTSNVIKIDAITVTQAVTGELDSVILQPVDIPNVVFAVREVDAKEVSDWFDDFIIKGNSSKERNGTLEFLETNLKDTLFALTLSNVGIIRIHRERSEQGAEVIARVRVTSYCEAMTFNSTDDAVTAAAATTGGAPEAAPGPAGGGASDAVSSAGTALAGAFLAAVDRIDRTGRSLTNASSNGLIEPELIAQRLRAAARSKSSGASALSKFDEGMLIGGRWATDTATLEELEQIAALESGEWTAIRLESGHSLITQLTQDGVVPVDDDGPLELERDRFVEGIVAGSSQVLRRAAPHLGQGPQQP